MKVSQWQALVEQVNWVRESSLGDEDLARGIAEELERQGLVIVPKWMIADSFVEAPEPVDDTRDDE